MACEHWPPVLNVASTPSEARGVEKKATSNRSWAQMQHQVRRWGEKKRKKKKKDTKSQNKGCCWQEFKWARLFGPLCLLKGLHLAWSCAAEPVAPCHTKQQRDEPSTYLSVRRRGWWQQATRGAGRLQRNGQRRQKGWFSTNGNGLQDS